MDCKLWLIRDSNTDCQFLFFLKWIWLQFRILCGRKLCFILKYLTLYDLFLFENWTKKLWLFVFSTFKKRRSMIERCFGILKNSYASVGTRKFRLRRHNGPLICNLTAALYNRRRLFFHNIRIASGHMYSNWMFYRRCLFVFKDTSIQLWKFTLYSSWNKHSVRNVHETFHVLVNVFHF